MHRHHLSRRLTAVAAAVGASAAMGAVASAPASAITCTDIYGSGSSFQQKALGTQSSPPGTAGAGSGVFLNNWTVGAGTSSCATTPKGVYTKTSSGQGLDEFGNNTGVVDKTKDPTANALGLLDAFVGTDDPPSAGQLGEAQQAAGARTLGEMTLPIAQSSVATLFSLPVGCTTTDSNLQINNTTLDSLWQGNYAAGAASHDWAQLLSDMGAGGVSAGCSNVPVKLEVRSSASGTSYAFKSYLSQVDFSKWAPYASDYVLWPGQVDSAGTTGNSGGGDLAQSVRDTPGSVGYAVISDSAGKGFSGTVTAQADGHQIAWANVQNNGTATSGATHTDPSLPGQIANCPNGTALLPSEKGAAYSATDSWYGVVASDPNVSADAGATYYPICALTYDLVWKHYAAPGLGWGANAATVAATVKDFFTYVIGQGQTDIQSSYYNRVPSGLHGKQSAVVNLIAS